MCQFNQSPIALLLGLLLSATAVAAGPATEEFAVTEQFAGTLVSVTPASTYDNASLRVVGPLGYEAQVRFTGGALFLDLAADRRPLPEGLASSQAASAAGGVPDGRYRWEARFWLPSGGEQVVSGAFVVGGGVIASRRDEVARLTSSDRNPVGAMEPLRTDTVSASDVGAESTTVDDRLFIRDVENDKLVSIQLALGNSIDGYDFRFWDLVNHDGLFRIDFDGNFIPPGNNKLSIAEDGDVGISTAAAAKRLTIHTTTIGDGIRLINDAGAFETSWDFSVDAFAGLNIQDVETGNSVMRLREGAPTDSLVVSASGNIGIGAGLPSARLHVAGSGIIEGDVSLGSSRSIKHAFEPLDSAAVLATVRDLPLFRWQYKDDPAQAPHVGPMAEDVYAAFAIGRDDKHLSPADSAGLALAAIQGVDGELERLRAQNRELSERLAAVEATLAAVVREPEVEARLGPPSAR